MSFYTCLCDVVFNKIMNMKMFYQPYLYDVMILWISNTHVVLPHCLIRKHALAKLFESRENERKTRVTLHPAQFLVLI